ncbi:MAG TPA: c-type cytochrome [Anaerolineales bacterium]|nr:c-type cytochrome [Anaerolineales bacterium]
MFSRFRIALGFALLLSLVIAIPAFAGGWAVITLDELPTGVVAGEPLTVGFTVLQHGRTPMSDLAPSIIANSKQEKFVVLAEPDGKPGHYTATLTFPKEGDWSWSIQAFTMEQPMPLLRVAAPASQPVVKTEPVPAPISPLLIVRGLAFGLMFAGLILAYRLKSRLALVLTVAALLIGVASFVTGSAVAEAEAQSKPSSKPDPSISQVELGEQLFVAKGCITCHVNNKVENASEYWTIHVTGATNLTKFTASPEALHLRLKDPASVKSDTQMPNLGLKEVEIEALIAFINSK